jgi:hypothetical protein
MKKVIRLMVITASIAVAAMSLAQQDGGPGAGRRGGGGQMGQGGGMRGGMGQQNDLMLIMRKDVQDDLKMTEDQRKAAEAAGRDLAMQMGQAARAARENGGDMQTIRKQYEDQSNAEAAKILEAGQEKRLGEIKLQLAGPRAIFDPKVQKALSLTDEQKSALKKVQNEDQKAREALRPQRQPGGGGQGGERPAPPSEEERTAMQAKMKELDDALKAKIDAILTDENKAALKAMMGEPFKAAQQAGQPGRPGGRRGGEGQPGGGFGEGRGSDGPGF